MGISISFGVDENGNIQDSIGEKQKIRNTREGKGKSILDFPDKYIAIDIETTGLSPQYDEIIEIAAIRYNKGQKMDSFTTLVKPDYEIDEYITELTGITNEMLENAPPIIEVIDEFYSFIGCDILVGHNVNFDINFLYDNLLNYTGKMLSNSFVDTMRIARRALPELKHHRLIDIAAYYNVSYEKAHRAERDCEICNDCLLALKQDLENKGVSLELFKKSKSHKDVSAKDISTENMEFDEEHPIFGKVCVFTGTLEKMQRKEAMQLVADLGGIPEDGVTKKTNYLVLGNNDYCKTIKDGKSTKQKKAEKLILDGADLQIIPEEVFYDLVLEE